ncbi:MAG: MarR family transcriptional regulator [Desulfobacteraceae bacterium]|nr:MarR family transcriptional regulator [Desulfobacteraceae bacterium]
MVKQVGLTGPQLITLREIANAVEISITNIAGGVSLSQPTVTGILDRLEKRGLVRKEAQQKRP